MTGKKKRKPLDENLGVGYTGEKEKELFPMEKRRSKYEAAADIIIQTDGKSAFQICEEIIQSANKA